VRRGMILTCGLTWVGINGRYFLCERTSRYSRVASGEKDEYLSHTHGHMSHTHGHMSQTHGHMSQTHGHMSQTHGHMSHTILHTIKNAWSHVTHAWSHVTYAWSHVTNAWSHVTHNIAQHRRRMVTCHTQYCTPSHTHGHTIAHNIHCPILSFQSTCKSFIAFVHSYNTSSERYSIIYSSHYWYC